MVQMRRKKRRDEYVDLIKYSLFVYNLLFFCCSAVIIGVGIWMAVDRSFMAEMTGDPLYAVAAYIILAGGCIMFVVTFFGCCGAISENKLLLWIFFAVLCLSLIILLLAAILAIAFRAKIGDSVQNTMRESLKEYYGVENYKRKNKAVTQAWDKAQEKLRCCAVDTNGWQLYLDTKWFKTYGEQDDYTDGSEIKRIYVPRSCCLRDRFKKYTDVDSCQKWEFGPPKLNEGAMNRALYYEGCYEAGIRYLKENSNILMGLGFCFTLVVCLGILLSWVLIKRLI